MTRAADDRTAGCTGDQKPTWAPGSVDVLTCLVRPAGAKVRWGENHRPELSAEARLVYLALFTYTDGSGACYPTVETLAAGTGLAERTVRYKLSELEGVGLLAREYPPGRAVNYHLQAPWEGCKTYTPAPDAPLQEMQPGTTCSPGVQEVQGGAASLAAKVTHASNPTKEPNSQADLFALDATESERLVLHELSQVKGYPLEFRQDLEYIRSLAVDFPTVDLLAAAKKWRTWTLDHPLKKKGNPRLRFRNWCEHEVKWRPALALVPAGKVRTERDRLEDIGNRQYQESLAALRGVDA